MVTKGKMASHTATAHAEAVRDAIRIDVRLLLLCCL